MVSSFSVLPVFDIEENMTSVGGFSTSVGDFSTGPSTTDTTLAETTDQGRESLSEETRNE